MKKWLIVGLLTYLLCFAGSAIAIEGTKTLGGPEFICQVTLPEQAPDFMYHPGYILGGKMYDNGRLVAMVESINPAGTVASIAWLMKDVDGSAHVIGLQVSYMPQEYFETGDIKYLKTETYVDTQMLELGRPSDTLVRCEGDLPWEKLEAQVSRTLETNI